MVNVQSVIQIVDHLNPDFQKEHIENEIEEIGKENCRTRK